MSEFVGGYVECENPNEMLYRFEGTIIVNGVCVPLSNDQMLLRGSSLRNTEYIYGLVVFTGHDSKIMRNSVKARAKFSKLELTTNNYIIAIIVIQMLLSLVAAVLNTMWEILYFDELHYLRAADDNLKTFWMLNMAIQLGTWFLSLGNFVPVSLLVTLEMVKFIQAAFINWDVSIYD